MPVTLSAECPYCGCILTVILGTCVDSRRGGCQHVEEITWIGSQIFVAFICPLKIS